MMLGCFALTYRSVGKWRIMPLICGDVKLIGVVRREGRCTDFLTRTVAAPKTTCDTATAYAYIAAGDLSGLYHRKSLLFPEIHAAPDDSGILVAKLVQLQRRTGACLFSQSGAIEDDDVIVG